MFQQCLTVYGEMTDLYSMNKDSMFTSATLVCGVILVQTL